MIYRLLLCSLCWLYSTTLPAHAFIGPKESKEKTIKATFNVQADDALSIDNRYGDVVIKNHNKNTIDVVVSIKAWNHSAAKAQKTIDRISIQQDQTGKIVALKTLIASAQNGTSVSSEQGFHINYTIHIPQSLSLTVRNEFGHLTIEDALGAVDLYNKHGHLTLGTIGPGTIQSAHGNFFAKKLTGATKVSSKHGNTTIQKADQLTLEAFFGNCLVRQVNRLSGTNKNGHITIEYVQQHLKWSSQFGNVLIKLVDKNFQHLELDAQHGNATIHVDHGATFALDSTVGHGKLTHPFGINTQKDQFLTKAKGAVHGGGSPLIIQVNFGNLVLQ